MATENNIPSNLNQSVWSCCEVIKYLSGKDWCRLKDIAQALNMDAAKAHRLLNTLAVHDFVQYDEDTHRYRLGFQFFTIAYHMSRSSIISAAKPHLEYAAGELFETINLGMLANDKSKLVHIYRLDGDLSASYDDIPLGVSRFANESALGKSILAYLPYGEQQSVLNRIEFHQYTNKTIITKEDLQQDLILTRERGYAIDDGEIEPGCYCMAMPIFDGTGKVVAAVSVAMKAKPEAKMMGRVLTVLKTTTERIAKSLGYK